MSNGYVYVFGNCAACHVPLCFNPLYVPSIRVYNKGEKKAICESCFKRWNEIHRPHDPLPIHNNAYKPLKENELYSDPLIESKYIGESKTIPKNNKNNGVNNNDDKEH